MIASAYPALKSWFRCWVKASADSDEPQVTQSNAANAEESASASEELSAQARELDGMVASLTAIVGSQQSGAPKLSAAKAKLSVASLRNHRSTAGPVHSLEDEDF